MIKIKNEKISVQEWLPIKESYNDGIIKLKNSNYIKIIKVSPINYDLKSDFEKKAILNSYKAFLKNCSFDIQIIIKSNKEDISKNIKELEKQREIEKKLNNYFVVKFYESYIKYIKEKNKEKLSSAKEFYIIFNSKKFPENQEKNIYIDLKEKYVKIRDSLSRCGNNIYEIKNKEEIKNIIKLFFINK